MAGDDSLDSFSSAESCQPEAIPPEMRELIEKFEKGEEYANWSWVRDYNIGENTLKLLSKTRCGTNLKEFLVYGELDVCKEKLLDLVMHMSRRVYWDDTYIEHEEVATNDLGTDIIFSVSKYPFPLAKRTYTITRNVYGSMDDIVVIFSKTIPYEMPKKYRWSTQVEDFDSLLIIRNKEGEKEYCDILVTYYENPKVILPATYLNIIIETLVPKVLEKMVIACKAHVSPRYDEYCKNMPLLPLEEYMKRGDSEE